MPFPRHCFWDALSSAGLRDALFAATELAASFKAFVSYSAAFAGCHAIAAFSSAELTPHPVFATSALLRCRDFKGGHEDSCIGHKVSDAKLSPTGPIVSLPPFLDYHYHRGIRAVRCPVGRA